MNKPVNCGCGGEAEIFHIAPEGYEGSYCVRCTECLTQTPFFNKDKDKAIEVWNRAMGADTNSVVSVFSSEVRDFRTTEQTAKVFQSIDGYRCAKCFYRFETTAIPQYCPQCGARLEWK